MEVLLNKMLVEEAKGITIEPSDVCGGCFGCDSLWITILLSCLVIFLITLVVCGFVEDIYKRKYDLQLDLQKNQFEHEREMKRLANLREDTLLESEKKRKDDDLERKIKEFRELTIQSKLLDKVIEKEQTQEIKDLQSTVDKLKEDLEKAKVEISGYVLKKENE